MTNARQITAVVSIGRNVGKLPMGDSDWADFADGLVHIIWDADGVTYFSGWGTGHSTARGERAEESYTVIFGVDAESVEEMLRRLGILAKAYRQEAIAVTVGATTFVGPKAAKWQDAETAFD